jgi:PIN domain nuclease of toxin-antitoxin system
MVFDASALLAWLLEERGSAVVERALESGGSVSAANWSEVAQKVGRRGDAWPATKEILLSYEIVVEPVTREDAEAAAVLWSQASQLSLADRLCLVLGQRLDTDVLTADAAWSALPRVTLIR